MEYIFLISIFALYVLFDVHYFIRALWIICGDKLFRKTTKVLDKTTTYGICTTFDMDITICHMNNARYQRELDFGRYFYSDRCGLYSAVMKRGLTVVGASTIRYCHKIPIFVPFKIVTEAIYWEEKAMYLQQKCITLHDNLVRAISITKHAIIGDINLHTLIAEVDPTARLPDLPEELELWTRSLEETSKKYRK